MAQFAGNAQLAEPLPLFAHRAPPTTLKCKNVYLVHALGEETAAQAVVGLSTGRRVMSGDERSRLRASKKGKLVAYATNFPFSQSEAQIRGLGLSAESGGEPLGRRCGM